jgi:hypothetical protein
MAAFVPPPNYLLNLKFVRPYKLRAVHPLPLWILIDKTHGIHTSDFPESLPRPFVISPQSGL